jgi:SAM-dependent methyltransferase
MNDFAPEPCMFDAAFGQRHAAGFDALLASQLLEHVADPAGAVQEMRRVLKPQGIAAIAVPHFGSALSRLQGRSDMFISPPEHLNFFSRDGLTSLFSRHGFKRERLQTVSKVNRGRIEEALWIPGLSHAAWIGLYAVLRVFEGLGLGMVINAYFRKSAAPDR